MTRAEPGCGSPSPGDWTAAGAWAVGALFIPTLALALGVWSGSGKLFEVVFLVLWYSAPCSGCRPWITWEPCRQAVKAGMPLVFWR